MIVRCSNNANFNGQVLKIKLFDFDLIFKILFAYEHKLVLVSGDAVWNMTSTTILLMVQNIFFILLNNGIGIITLKSCLSFLLYPAAPAILRPGTLE